MENLSADERKHLSEDQDYALESFKPLREHWFQKTEVGICTEISCEVCFYPLPPYSRLVTGTIMQLLFAVGL